MKLILYICFFSQKLYNLKFLVNKSSIILLLIIKIISFMMDCDEIPLRKKVMLFIMQRTALKIILMCNIFVASLSR